MAANSTKKLPLEPRLPVVGGTDYDQQLSRALYDILRQLATRVNAMDVAAVLVASGTGSWSAGTGLSQTIAHGLGYLPDIKKVQVQMTGLFPTPLVPASLLMSVSAVSATYITVNRPDSTHAYSFAWRIYS